MVSSCVNWAALDDAYGDASGVPALLQGMLEGDESATFELAGRLVHQGWRYSATLESLGYLIDRCMTDDRLLERCIEPILLFATGDLADFFPHAAMHHDACPAIAAAAERCIPSTIAMDAARACRSFVPRVKDRFSEIKSARSRVGALQFLYCFAEARNSFARALDTSLRSPSEIERLGAICLASLDGVAVCLAHQGHTTLSVELNGLVARATIADVSALDLPVMNRAWEIALIPGCVKSGQLLALRAMVEERLDEWRRDFFEVCVSRFASL